MEKGESLPTSIFSREHVCAHARFMESSSLDPGYVSAYLTEFLKNSGYEQDPELQEVRDIIERQKEKALSVSQPGRPVNPDFLSAVKSNESQRADREVKLRKDIEDYYLPKQLVDAILENGEIPKNSVEMIVGIGFIDIADYTYLSKFLSPKENQIILNGLYAAFNWVLKRHGGYLNKIEGDSIMFHFGGLIDPKIKGLSVDEQSNYISKELFYTCIEMQRVCFLFNEANDKFLYGNDDDETIDAVQNAYSIIGMLRTSAELSSSINALFQIRIRVGANIGEVTMGNFGPTGAKHWDVVGVPVIKAKRMEATAPVGGFRISEEMYRILEKTGVVDSYYDRFRREAQALFGCYKDIKKEELFSFGKVLLKDKKNAEFATYSIQVNPGLPEAIARQVDLLLEKGREGVDRIIQLLQYYRGNKFVINSVESVFTKKAVELRKADILKLIMPKKFARFVEAAGGEEDKARPRIEEEYSLFRLFERLGEMQDKIKSEPLLEVDTSIFTDYASYMKRKTLQVKEIYKLKGKYVTQRTYFFNYIYPMVFDSIKASVYEYQARFEELSEVESPSA